MSAIFKWAARPQGPTCEVGDQRVIVRFLLWPKKLRGEWRWLGFEWIVQEFQSYRVQPPEMKAMDVVGWRDIDWDQ